MTWLARNKAYLTAACVALGAASTATADLALTGGSESRAPSAASPNPQSPPPILSETHLFEATLSWAGTTRPAAGVSGIAGRDTVTHEAWALPPGPGSASLFLSAIAGFGAWHLGRSVRKVHIGTLPEWYHAGGPAQVGHATPFDLDFSLSAMPVCRFEAPVAAGDEKPSRWRLLRLEPGDRPHSQFFLIVADPRGPPLYS